MHFIRQITLHRDKKEWLNVYTNFYMEAKRSLNSATEGTDSAG